MDRERNNNNSQSGIASENNLVSKLKACAYCGIHDPTCLVFCNKTKKWFCNDTQNSAGSHAFTHLILACATEVVLGEDAQDKCTPLNCGACGTTNVFELGFIPMESGLCCIRCRTSFVGANPELASSPINNWIPVIEGRQFSTMLVKVPTGESRLGAQELTLGEIHELEQMWAKDPKVEIRENVSPIHSACRSQYRYQSEMDYYRTFSDPLQSEAEVYNKLCCSSRISVKIAFSDQHVASLRIPNRYDLEPDVEVGDEIEIFMYKNFEMIQSRVGTIISVPDDVCHVMSVQLDEPFAIREKSTSFIINLNWRSIGFRRMKYALDRVLIGSPFLSLFLRSRLLGHDMEDHMTEGQLPEKFSVPNLPKLNESQSRAVRMALEQHITLIQCPPGTGKAITTASIVYHLRKTQKRKVLTVAPSVVEVIDLCEKISQTGLKVVLVSTLSEDRVPDNIKQLMLHQKMSRLSQYQDLHNIHRLIYKKGKLSETNVNLYRSLKLKLQTQVFKNADVVCCTCISADQEYLKDFNFESVLIVDSTNVTEPECLIPLTKGCHQMILLGDHCHSGPKVRCKNAAEAGLSMSLFERLVRVGVPFVRLQVQYRINRELMRFSNRVFYENDLESIVRRSFWIKWKRFPWPNADRPMFFYCHPSQEEIAENGTSILNRTEALVVEKIVTRFLEIDVEPNSIGVIVSDEGQQDFMTKYLLRGKASNVQVTTVNDPQYRVKDYIIFSCVRANKNRQIGVLSDPRLLNVILTSARDGLIIVGEPTTFCEDPFWNDLLHFYSDQNLLVQGELDNLVRYELKSPKPQVPCTYKLDDNSGLNKTTIA